MAPVQLYATYRLPRSLLVDPSVLAKSWPLVLAERRGKILMPRITSPASAERPYSVGPPIDDIVEGRASGLYVDRADDRHDWADVTAYKDGTPTVAQLKSIVMRFDRVSAEDVTYADCLHGRGHPRGDLVHGIAADVDRWFERVATWTSALCDQDTEIDPLRLATAVGEGFTPWTVDSAGTKSLPGLDQTIQITWLNEEVLSRSQWELALSHANAGADVPVAHQLMLQARADLRRGRTRRAVIDAGTAVEMVLNEMFQREIRRLTKSQRDGLLREQRTLGRLYTTLKRMRTLPIDLNERLISVRNAAIHQNITPGYAAGKDAIDAANAVVVELYPLD